MFVSFGMAEHLNGECVLRFDDTNPEAEKQEYIDHIQDIVSWMGWKPSKASTHSNLSLCACTVLQVVHAQAKSGLYMCLMRIMQKTILCRNLIGQMGKDWFCASTTSPVLQSNQFYSLVTLSNIPCGIH